ncbi:hypothetical protein ABLE93_11270 [Xanthobacter sp. KR7-65]|uniref:hypothetical protein n=1 Tax=Xanthobacter sp. KR7-65 TaxID=3156612 RepID=UPI0032B46A63
MTGWRFLFLAPAVLFAAIAALLPGAPARAQEAVALAFEGWDRSESADGVVTFRCNDPRCPPRSKVSYKRQPHRPTVSLAQFEAHHSRLSREAPANSSGHITAARITGFSERTVEGVRVLSGNREVAWTSGGATAAVDALLIGPTASFSVVSDAADPKTAAAVFAHFLPRLIDLVLVTR